MTYPTLRRSILAAWFIVAFTYTPEDAPYCVLSSDLGFLVFWTVWDRFVPIKDIRLLLFSSVHHVRISFHPTDIFPRSGRNKTSVLCVETDSVFLQPFVGDEKLPDSRIRNQDYLANSHDLQNLSEQDGRPHKESRTKDR